MAAAIEQGGSDFLQIRQDFVGNPAPHRPQGGSGQARDITRAQICAGVRHLWSCGLEVVSAGVGLRLTKSRAAGARSFTMTSGPPEAVSLAAVFSDATFLSEPLYHYSLVQSVGHSCFQAPARG